MTLPSGVKAGGVTSTTRGKIPKIVATFVCASSNGQRTHSARTNSFIWVSSENTPPLNFFFMLKLTRLKFSKDLLKFPLSEKVLRSSKLYFQFQIHFFRLTSNSSVIVMHRNF